MSYFKCRMETPEFGPGVIAGGLARPHLQRSPGFSDQLPWRYVHAHDRTAGNIGSLVDIQHLLHVGHRVAILAGRQLPDSLSDCPETGACPPVTRGVANIAPCREHFGGGERTLEGAFGGSDKPPADPGGGDDAEAASPGVTH